MRFFRGDASIVAEAVRTGKRYSLKPWQYELLSRFDGKRTFEEVAKEIYHGRPGAFTATGLLNFYNWLYTENLVLCECESIFELVLGEPDADEGDEAAESGGGLGALSSFAVRLLEDSRMRRSLAVAVALVFCLSIIRLVQVAAPAFEPPVQRLYAEASRLLERPAPAVSVATSERSAAEPSVEKVSLASRMPAVPEETAPPAKKAAADEAAAGSDAATVPDLMERIESLRVQLEECRIRRDEFYLQNDEEGYRREVHRMTNLAKEIGDIEKSR